MNQIRQPAVAGMFYPVEEDILKKDIQSYLNDTTKPVHALKNIPKAIVVPHAGYVYSGSIAASAYKLLIPFKHQIKRVVLLGPSHQVAFKGLAVPESDTFHTPLGNIPIDREGIALLSDLTQVIASDVAHRDEHSLEVQLPFLQEILDDFSLIPLVVGDAERHEVAEVISRLWEDGEDGEDGKDGQDGHTLIVISTDLSHYHEYSDAKKRDRATSDAITYMKPDLIDYEDACGRNGLKGMLTVAQQKSLSVEVLDVRNSGDTAGSKDRVVGYGAYVFY